jgi:hypothetical protein
LKKTLKKTPRKETKKKENVKEEPIEIPDESMVISDGEEIAEINSSQEANEKSGDEFDTTAEMEQEEEEDGEVQE